MQMIEGFSRIDEEKLVGYVLSQRPTPLAGDPACSRRVSAAKI